MDRFSLVLEPALGGVMFCVAVVGIGLAIGLLLWLLEIDRDRRSAVPVARVTRARRHHSSLEVHTMV